MFRRRGEGSGFFEFQRVWGGSGLKIFCAIRIEGVGVSHAVLHPRPKTLSWKPGVVGSQFRSVNE